MLGLREYMGIIGSAGRRSATLAECWNAQVAARLNIHPFRTRVDQAWSGCGYPPVLSDGESVNSWPTKYQCISHQLTVGKITININATTNVNGTIVDVMAR